MATGGAVVASQYLGRRDRDSACCAAKQLLYTSLVLSLTIMALALPFQRPLLAAIFGSIEPGVMTNAQTYFGLSLASYPFWRYTTAAPPCFAPWATAAFPC